MGVLKKLKLFFSKEPVENSPATKCLLDNTKSKVNIQLCELQYSFASIFTDSVPNFIKTISTYKLQKKFFHITKK